MSDDETEPSAMTAAERDAEVMAYMEYGYDFDDVEQFAPELYRLWIDDMGLPRE